MTNLKKMNENSEGYDLYLKRINMIIKVKR